MKIRLNRDVTVRFIKTSFDAGIPTGCRFSAGTIKEVTAIDRPPNGPVMVWLDERNWLSLAEGDFEIIEF